jgi:3-hydroxyisobutyrate dehydrogenase
MMLKDLLLAQDAARSTGAATPLGAEAAALYRLYHAHGQGAHDFSGIIRFLRGN